MGLSLFILHGMLEVGRSSALGRPLIWHLRMGIRVVGCLRSGQDLDVMQYVVSKRERKVGIESSDMGFVVPVSPSGSETAG